MPSNEEKSVLKYDNIVVSPRGMAEAHGRKVVIFVPAADINRVTLKFGRTEHNPIASICVGAAFAAVGIFGLVLFFVRHKGNRYYLGLVTLGIIGGSFIFDALKQRYFLEIDKKNDTRRLVFSKNAKKNDLDDFCNKIRTIYKYEIKDDVRHGR
jgi:hypothetical protein